MSNDLLPPRVQAALAHARFDTIHPCEDGNGRTGPALVHVTLRRRWLAPHFIPPVSVVLAAAALGRRYDADLYANLDGESDSQRTRLCARPDPDRRIDRHRGEIGGPLDRGDLPSVRSV